MARGPFRETFRTERLVVRPPTGGDGAAEYVALTESIDHLWPWFGWAKDPHTRESREEYAAGTRRAFDQRRSLAYYLLLPSGAYVGQFWTQGLDWDVPKAELGYWCSARYGGQGFMTEGMSVVLDYMFAELGFERLELTCDVGNVRSRRLAERLEFRLEGILARSSRRADGELVDRCMYARLRGDGSGAAHEAR